MSDEKWIQKAIKHPGLLRAYVKRWYGDEAFDRKGRIKVSILRKLAKRNDSVGRRARLALTLRRLSRRRASERKKARLRRLKRRRKK